jgi:putative membrane protein
MKLSKISIPYRAGQKLLGITVFTVFAASGSLASASIPAIAGLLLLGFTGILFVSAYEYLYWNNFEYMVEQDGLKIVSGVISKNDRDIPLRRIQNVDINRNIVQRLLGIAKADIETAGGGSTEASLKYVDYEDAQTLQKQVRELKNRRKSDVEQEGEEPGRERDDFVLSDRNLAILSLASVDMRVIGAVGFLFSIFGGAVGSQMEGILPQTLGFAAIAAFAVLSIGAIWLSSAASKFVKFYEFRLQFHDNAIEYERGLLNRASGTIPEEKIQDIIIEENFIQRRLGFASLEVETAGYSQQQGEIDTGSETVIPLAKRSEVEKFAQEIGGYTQPDLQFIHEKAQKRYFHRYVLAGALLGLIGFAASQLFELSPVVYLPAMVVLISSKKAAQLKWENIGYCLDEKRVFTRKGFWNRSTYVIPYFRVQNLMEEQTVFQRRWGQSTLLLDTAGSVMSYPMIVDMDRQEAKELRQELFERFKESLRR